MSKPGMLAESRIYVAGHRGMVGSAIWRLLEARGFKNLLGRSRAELNLLDQTAVARFFEIERPEFVFLAAATVGGIQANREKPATFIYENLQIQNNIIHSAYKTGVRKLLSLGSSCIYPRLAPQPLKEEYLLSGPLEPTNEGYAIAKIAALKMCEAYRVEHGCDFISAMPTNLYGPNDNYDLNTSHVLPALIRKFHEAKVGRRQEVVLWGTGSPRREFLHVDDVARACLFLMENYSAREFVNIGAGEDLTIRELAEVVRKTVGFEGQVTWDTSKPDGTPRKLLDVTRIQAMGWKPEIDLATGIRSAYEAFLKQGS